MGLTTSHGLRAGVCSDENPRCVNDTVGAHNITRRNGRELVLSEGVMTCWYRPGKGQQPCGAHLYAAQLSVGGSPLIRGHGERVWLVVEVNHAQIEYMRHHPMIFLERMVLFGASAPGVELDLRRWIARDKTA